MTYEELKTKKIDKINEWLVYLNNNKDDGVDWKFKNKVFANQVVYYLDSIKKQKKDIVVDLQYDFIRSIENYINDLNVEKIYYIVNNLKNIEDVKQSNVDIDEGLKEMNDYIKSYFDGDKKSINLNGNTNVDFKIIDELEKKIDEKILEIEKEELIKKEERNNLQELEIKDNKELSNNQLNDNSFVSNHDKITITKEEYDNLKESKKELQSIYDFIDLSNEFSLKIFKGVHKIFLPKADPYYNNYRISIEINSLSNYKIQINNIKYMLTDKKYEIIKNTIEKEFSNLVDLAKKEDYNYLMQHGYEGGETSEIMVKFNGLIISIGGQVSGNIGEYCNLFIEKIKNIIIVNDSNEQ